MTAPARTPLSVRFAQKFERGAPDECWPWQAGLTTAGYGFIGAPGGSPQLLAHRVAWEEEHGPIPDGLTIDHLCRNRRCVNVAHLEMVTRIENVMRGESQAARNARKDQCIRGHPFDEENTYYPPSGGRRCRTCTADRHRRRRAA